MYTCLRASGDGRQAPGGQDRAVGHSKWLIVSGHSLLSVVLTRRRITSVDGYSDCMKIPTQVWIFGRRLFWVRIAFVGLLVLGGHPKAGLELGYKPALVADFPVSLLYLI